MADPSRELLSDYFRGGSGAICRIWQSMGARSGEEEKNSARKKAQINPARRASEGDLLPDVG